VNGKTKKTQEMSHEGIETFLRYKHIIKTTRCPWIEDELLKLRQETETFLEIFRQILVRIEAEGQRKGTTLFESHSAMARRPSVFKLGTLLCISFSQANSMKFSLSADFY